MVWSAMQAFAAYTAKEVEFGYGFLPLFITEPFNARLLSSKRCNKSRTHDLPPVLQYSIMFPGESELLQISSAFHSHENIQHQQYIAKGSVSALYCRLMLLWCSCLRLKHNALLGFDSEDYSPEEIEKRRAEFAIRAWSESMVIEEALERHTCQKDQLAIFATRNWIFGYVCFLRHWQWQSIDGWSQCPYAHFTRFLVVQPQDVSWYRELSDRRTNVGQISGVHASFNRESIEEWSTLRPSCCLSHSMLTSFSQFVNN